MVKIYLDTANLDEIKEILEWDIICGITTNQKIFEKEKGCNFKEQAQAILELVYPFPVSLEGPNNLEGIIKVAEEYDKWGWGPNGTNVVVKVPMLRNGDGLNAVRQLSNLGIATNVTACITLNQTFLAANAGASYVSLFYNRMKDWKYMELDCKWNWRYMELDSKWIPGDDLNDKKWEEATQYALDTIENTMDMLVVGGYETQLIVGSIRSPEDIEDILTRSPHIITIPTKIIKQMPHNEMTDRTLKEFDEAWTNFKNAEKK
jgi:transaldolase